MQTHPMHHARAARAKALRAALQRKEEFLGARVPKELRERIMARAREMNVPISILIRDILEKAMGDTATAPSAASCPAYEHVIGWEAIRVHRQTTCSACRKVLSAGMAATLGITATREAPLILCNACKDDV